MRKLFILFGIFFLFGFCAFGQIPDSLDVKPLFFYKKEQLLQKKHLSILEELQKNTGVQTTDHSLVPDLFRRQYFFLKSQNPLKNSPVPQSQNLRKLPLPKNKE